MIAIIFLMTIAMPAADGTWTANSPDGEPCDQSGMAGFFRKSWRRKVYTKILNVPRNMIPSSWGNSPILGGFLPYLCSFEEDSNIFNENESAEYSEDHFQQQPSHPRKVIEIADLNNLLLNKKIKKQLTAAAKDKEEGRKSEPVFRSFMGLRGKRFGA